MDDENETTTEYRVRYWSRLSGKWHTSGTYHSEDNALEELAFQAGRRALRGKGNDGSDHPEPYLQSRTVPAWKPVER